MGKEIRVAMGRRMSVPSSSKRELEVSGEEEDSPAAKRQRQETTLEEEERETRPSDAKNLLKSGRVPSPAAYHLKRLTLGLYIPPVDSIAPEAGIERQLDDVLWTYLHEARGILMGWRDPVPCHEAARVLDESPFSFAKVAVECCIWRPRRGEELEGKVKFMGPSHIGLLILGTFNASVPLQYVPDNWTFQEDFTGGEGAWRDGNGTLLGMDQPLRFKVVNIKKGANILSVEGSLLEQVFQPKYQDSEAVEQQQGVKKEPQDAADEQEKQDDDLASGQVMLSKAERKARRKSEKRARRKSEQGVTAT